jgi:hypothetical protein
MALGSGFIIDLAGHTVTTAMSSPTLTK